MGYQQGGWGSNCGGGLPPMNGHMSMKSKDINGQNNNNNNGNNGTNNNGMNGLVAPGSGMGMFVQPNGMTAPGMVSGPGGMMMAAMQGMTGPMGGVMPKQEDGTLQHPMMMMVPMMMPNGGSQRGGMQQGQMMPFMPQS